MARTCPPGQASGGSKAATLHPRDRTRSGRPTERSDRPEPVGSVLGELVRTRPWTEGMAVGRLGRGWAEVVGERLAAECVPVRLQAGTLYVRASSAAWATQIRFLASDVAQRANALLREVAVAA